MTIEASDLQLTIGFGREEATWSLLVIDDKWDVVKEMVCGEYDRLSTSGTPGLGEKCLDPDVVKRYWKARFPSRDTFERALVLMPAMVAGAEGYGAITFCGFPECVEKLRAILADSLGGEAPQETGTEVGPLQSPVEWAVLIDISKDSPGEAKEECFGKTWEMLDAIGHPAFARAKFTKGGVALPEWAEKIEIVYKESPGDFAAHKALVQDWLSKVRGVLSDESFQDWTNDCCHDPTKLSNATLSQRERICAKLVKNDLYGVWRWCAPLARQEPLPPTAMHRWLAAKAFQTWPTDLPQVPVTAVVAICEGAVNLVSPLSPKWSYTVDSTLYEIKGKGLDKLQIIGFLNLHCGDYGGFAAALRGWLAVPEQTDAGNGMVERVTIQTRTLEAEIRFEYSAELPERVFRSKRRGQARRRWDALKKYAHGSSHNGKVVVLTFSFAPE